MPRVPARTAALLALTLSASCHQAGGTASFLPPFTAAGSAPTGAVFLDQVLQVVCSTAIDAGSISASGLQLEAIDGPGRGLSVRGNWRTASLGPDAPDRVLEFVPALPQGELSLPGDAGLQPDTTYVLRLTAGTGALRDRAGRAITAGVSFTFRTVAGAPWFRTPPGGARVNSITALPRDANDRWRLGRTGDFAQLRLEFDQPLDPTAANLPRRPDRTGPIVLEYDDPEYGSGTWIPIDVELERNAQDGATVVVRPRGILPNAADVRVRIADSLRDLSGETAGTAQVATVRTEEAYEPQCDALVARFGTDALVNDFFEPEATIQGGVLQPPEFAATGTATGDWQPAGTDTFLDTRSQDLQLGDGRMQRFEGGTFHVRNLRINAGQVVRGLGPNPLVFVVDGDATIAGDLTVSGADAGGPLLAQGYRGPGDIPPPNIGGGGPGGSPPVPQPLIGTQGHCGGGHGGRAGPVFQRAMTGQAGFGSSNLLAGGGGGGLLSCITGCGRGSGGGGGSFATAGDPGFPAAAGPATSFQQVRGAGGQGCQGASGAATRTLAGGAAGPRPFANASADDDHWGVAWNPRTRTRILGELSSPRGGTGGGAGGDLSNNGCEPNNPNFVFDARAGNGGAGGGVLILKVRGTLTLAATGRIRANGGDGIGGHQARSSNQAGGGGGGSGGMVVLMAGERIVLHVHGETFANQDYDFAISADGGVCTTGPFAVPVVTGKYPASGTPVMAGTTYDGAPLGGFGGLGVIQLMAPTGSDNADGTNTVLDDSIDIVRNGQPLLGAEKQRYLAWRGFTDGSGANVDDFGTPTHAGGGEGDFRPSPLLMPSPFSARARARSTWLPLGAAVRRRLQAPDGLPRGVTGEGGPAFGPASSRDGWLPSVAGVLEPGSAAALLPAPAAVASFDAAAVHAGRPALAISLAASVLGAEPDRYAGHIAELFGRGGLLATLRIRSHDASTLWLDPIAAPTGLTAVQVRAWFVDLQAPIATWRGADGTLLPRSNARIGFAFHRAPARALPSGTDPDRFPAQVGTFVHDFGDPVTATALRAFGASHVQWDVLFDQALARTPADRPPPPDASTRLSLRALWLPYRF